MNNSSLAFGRDFLKLVAPYFTGDQKWKAWGLLGVIVAMNLGIVYINVLLNAWNNDFYNALQNLDKDAFFQALIKFSYLAGAYIVLAVYALYLSQLLQLRWREWLTHRALTGWLSSKAYYRMQIEAGEADNPDQRISEDIDRLTSGSLSLGLGLMRSVVTLSSFVAILWTLSGPAAIPLGSWGELHIPGYMVFAALIYAVGGTWLTMRVGNPLARLNFEQQRREADFRFSMVRLRENSESVAIYGGEPQELSTFKRLFGGVVGNFHNIMIRQKRLTWLTAGYFQLSAIFPLIVAAPRFFAGQIQLGGLMQISSAFRQVHDSLSFIVDSYVEIASLKAVVARLSGFEETLARVTAASGGVDRTESEGGQVCLERLCLTLPDGRELARELKLRLHPGDSLLVTGPSGSGKSTLLRALAGIWPFGSGLVSLPGRGRIMFLSQKPYLPLGTLRQAVFYPYQSEGQDPAVQTRAEDLLEHFGLGHLSARLDETGNWAQALSPGEQQRLSFIRALIHEPDVVFLDEATASLDEPSEARLYEELGRRLPKSIIVSVGHRSTLLSRHGLRLDFDGLGGWRLDRLDRPDRVTPETSTATPPLPDVAEA